MVSALIIQRLSRNGYRLSWTSGVAGAVFRVYRDGVLLGTTTAASYDVTIEAGESPVFDVIDDGETAPDEGFPGYVTLGWFTPSTGNSVDRYLVQQLIAAVWTTIATVRETGAGYYNWRSGWLADDTSHQFRVVPVGSNENNGTVAALTVLMVRNPSPPDSRFAFDAATAKVTIQ